jgi:DNA-binding HxlR family transcriptional regulator
MSEKELAKCSDAEFWKERTLALRDAVELLGGKWKICILQNLSSGTLRFKDLQQTVVGISPKVLSKELQELEQNQLITRTVNNTKPVTVSYALTEHAHQTKPVFDALLEFGAKHRKTIKGR